MPLGFGDEDELLLSCLRVAIVDRLLKCSQEELGSLCFR